MLDAGCWMLDARGEWRVASGEWRVASGEWRVASGEWRVASGEWRVASGEWRVASGEWRVANGEWRMANGEWRMANGERGPDRPRPRPRSPTRPRFIRSASTKRVRANPREVVRTLRVRRERSQTPKLPIKTVRIDELRAPLRPPDQGKEVERLGVEKFQSQNSGKMFPPQIFLPSLWRDETGRLSLNRAPFMSAKRHDRGRGRGRGRGRAESREPRAESREPRAENREPRAESREPRTENRDPRTGNKVVRPSTLQVFAAR